MTASDQNKQESQTETQQQQKKIILYTHEKWIVCFKAVNQSVGCVEIQISSG